MFKVISQVSDKGGEIPVKRFYLDGAVLETVCPKCSRTLTRDLGGDYLSYPRIGSFKLDFRCSFENCEWEWQEPAILSINIFPDNSTGADNIISSN